MTRKRKTFLKKDVCDISDNDLLLEIDVFPIENSNKSVVFFRGESYIVKTGDKSDIIKAIKSQCSCNCGSEIKL